MKTKILPIAFLLIILAIVVILATKYSSNTPEQSMKDDTSKIVSKEVAQEANKTITQNALVVAVVSDPDTQAIKLYDVTGGISSADAYLLKKDTRTYHYVSAQLPDPKDNMQYEGWLVKTNDDESVDFFSTGTMSKDDDANYTLFYATEEDKTGYNKAVITLESVLDETPETHILEGIFN